MAGAEVDYEGLLIAVAEIAVAIAGFSGIAAALRHDATRRWSERDRGHFENLLLHSGIALFSALVPLIFAARYGIDAELWSVSSYSWAGFGVAGIAASVAYDRSRGRSAGWWGITVLLAFLAMVAFQFANGLWLGAFWVYFAGLVFSLAFAFIQFVGLALPRDPDAEGA